MEFNIPKKNILKLNTTIFQKDQFTKEFLNE